MRKLYLLITLLTLTGEFAGAQGTERDWILQKRRAISSYASELIPDYWTAPERAHDQSALQDLSIGQLRSMLQKRDILAAVSCGDTIAIKMAKYTAEGIDYAPSFSFVSQLATITLGRSALHFKSDYDPSKDLHVCNSTHNADAPPECIHYSPELLASDMGSGGYTKDNNGRNLTGFTSTELLAVAAKSVSRVCIRALIQHHDVTMAIEYKQKILDSGASLSEHGFQNFGKGVNSSTGSLATTLAIGH